MLTNSRGSKCKRGLTEDATDRLILPLLPAAGIRVLGDLRVDGMLDRVHHVDLLVDYPDFAPHPIAASLRARCDCERRWGDFTQTTRNADGSQGEAFRSRSELLILAYIIHPGCRRSPGSWKVTKILIGDLTAMRDRGPDKEIKQAVYGNGQTFGTWNYVADPDLVIGEWNGMGTVPHLQEN